MMAEVVDKPPTNLHLFVELLGVVGLHGELFFRDTVLLFQQKPMPVALCEKVPDRDAHAAHQKNAHPLQEPSAKDRVILGKNPIPDAGAGEKGGAVQEQVQISPAAHHEK